MHTAHGLLPVRWIITMMRAARVIPATAAIVVGTASFILSFVALRDVAASVGAVPADLAWLVPIVVDGGVLAASAALWSSSYRNAKRDPFAFFMVAFLLGFSVVVNASHAGDSPLAKAIAALPPLVLLACLELVAASHKQPDSPARRKAAARQQVVLTKTEALSPEPAARKDESSKPAVSTKTASLVKADSSKAELVRAEFDRHLLEGGDPSDLRLAAQISASLDVTPAYVRRIIKPLREDTLVR